MHVNRNWVVESYYIIASIVSFVSIVTVMIDQPALVLQAWISSETVLRFGIALPFEYLFIDIYS
jgi:hypothetical protein